MTVVPATIAQLNYIESLVDQKEMTDDARKEAMLKVEQTRVVSARLKGEVPIDKALASRWIERLKSLPKRTSGTPNSVVTPRGFFTVEYHDVGMTKKDGTKNLVPLLIGGDKPIPRGSYAIRTPNDPTNSIKFYQVWMSYADDERYGSGKWNVRVCHGPESSDLRSKAAQATIARKIAEDPQGAASLFGLEIGSCGICGRRLTNEVSRRTGIGPICAGRFGW